MTMVGTTGCTFKLHTSEYSSLLGLPPSQGTLVSCCCYGCARVADHTPPYPQSWQETATHSLGAQLKQNLHFYNGCKCIFKVGIFGLALLCFGMDNLTLKFIQKNKQKQQGKLKKNDVGVLDHQIFNILPHKLLTGQWRGAEMPELDPKTVGNMFSIN